MAASTDFHSSQKSHYQLKPAVIDRKLKRNVYVFFLIVSNPDTWLVAPQVLEC